MRVRTTDLRPGDYVLFADLTDRVIAVDLPDTGRVACVRTYRNGRYCFFHAGLDAEHDIYRGVQLDAV